ncbi:MAG: MoxR family ATPase [Nitrospirae bacterium]|nr:MoxR family ATPase [Nitrospirota bacterium]MBI5694250.1 MoxR family ATPase [Nitrospirota bacterium]
METKKAIDALVGNVGRVIKGKPDAVKLAVVALIGRGHLLIEDVPGIGKTTLGYSLARSVNCSFHRIQFTSDLLPSDITGVTIFNQTTQEFEFKEGPIFANIVLADEINRTSPKSQSALLEAMNEGQVTVEKTTFPLPRPFMVIATQNPLEYHGTFPLPESQLDRFMMRIKLGYPDMEHEKEILKASSERYIKDGLEPVLAGADVLKLQDLVDGVKMDDALLDYILAIVDATRRSDKLALGVSPRGALFLQKAARAMAMVSGRDYCIPDDIKGLAVPVLSHRVALNARGGFGRRAGDAEDAVADIVEAVEVPV